MSKKIVVTALSAVLALGLGTGANAADTGTAKHVKVGKNMEKCYGIAMAGKNDCSSGSQSCAGGSKVDSAKDAWISVPKGTCDRIVGGSTTEGKNV